MLFLSILPKDSEVRFGLVLSGPWTGKVLLDWGAGAGVGMRRRNGWRGRDFTSIPREVTLVAGCSCVWISGGSAGCRCAWGSGGGAGCSCAWGSAGGVGGSSVGSSGGVAGCNFVGSSGGSA